MHDSGKRQEFSGGAVRDTAEGKPRPDLISPFAEERLGAWMALGAKKYGERNYEKGMPLSRLVASLARHMMHFRQGDRSEDHLAAILFNAGALAHGEEMLKRSRWPKEFDDLPDYSPMPGLPQVPKMNGTCNLRAEGGVPHAIGVDPEPQIYSPPVQNPFDAAKYPISYFPPTVPKYPSTVVPS